MHRMFRRYLMLLLLGVLLLPMLMAAVNALVDPYHALPGLSLDVFHEQRRRYGRRAKAQMLIHLQPRVALLGSSRVESALDPAHPAFAGQTAVNLGLNRYSHEELDDIAAAALEQPSVDLLIVGLDFFGSNALTGVGPIEDASLYEPPKALEARRTGREEFLMSRFNPSLNEAAYLADTLLGPDTTSKSIQIVEAYFKEQPNDFTPQGFRKPRSRGAHPAVLFEGSLHRFLTWSSLYAGYRPGPRHDEAIARLVARCRSHHKRLILFIPPVHALQMEAIREAGLEEEWRDWKRRMLAIVEADAAAHPDAEPVPLWDFQGYGRYTMERVPVEPDGAPTPDAGATVYFSESSHCTREVGDAILSRMLGDDAGGSFGVRLTSADLEAHLARIDADRRDYLASHPDQVAFFKRVLRHIAEDSVGDEAEP